MRNGETSYEPMLEDDDRMSQLNAAEGLVKLGDKRGAGAWTNTSPARIS